MVDYMYHQAKRWGSWGPGLDDGYYSDKSVNSVQFWVTNIEIGAHMYLVLYSQQ